MHGIILDNSVRAFLSDKNTLNDRLQDKVVETSDFVNVFPLSSTESTKIEFISETDEKEKWQHVTSLCVSVYNKTKKQYEIECVDECCLKGSNMVFANYRYEDIVHVQRFINPECVDCPHIIIPFSSSLFGNIAGMVNFYKLQNVSLTLSLKNTVENDEYECYISTTRATTLRFLDNSVAKFKY